ncbi:redoxin family protein [Sphingomicrobium astaxanthinifaciens]|uniref:redoxin family protein n=1 Tax=Sphingomicrobium astaxanthinifaciens TaxID=1227949 RepID=UPI001FCB3B9B|nr:redoxin family protein [Sphingomicrobium astaxanthinifaciens]MCJ7420257.1 redoxin family protein [Sphingomicrobium astaxanthinifaciens]
MVARYLPLAVGLLVFAFIGWRLADPSDQPDISSRLVGAPAPDLTLAPMLADRPGVTGLATGEPHLVNLFGSWCNPCIAEAPLLDALAARGVPITGIAVRDEPQAVTRFLEEHGDPFAVIGSDPQSEAVFALGATGVPETFLVDAEGVIRAHVQGPLAPGDVDRLAAAWEALR